MLPGRTPIGFDQAMAKIESIGNSIDKALGGFNGEGGGGGIGKLVESLQQTSDELRALIAENRTSLNGTVKNFERFSGSLADELPRIADSSGSCSTRSTAWWPTTATTSRGASATSKSSPRACSARSTTSTRSPTRSRRGEGTIGKLVNSDQAHEELIGALGSVEKGVTTLTDTLGRVNKLKLDIGMEGYYLNESGDGRSAARVDLLPRGDESPHLYRVELVSDPRGRLYEKDSTSR